jgi:hypothetical protein
MENFDNALIVIILVIFAMTAIISLGSIPDWIKIPEWYKKKLFTVLIIEVIAIVLAYSAQKFSGTRKEEAIKYDKQTELNLTYFSDNDSIYALAGKDTLGKFSRDKLYENKAYFEDLFTHIQPPASDYGDYVSIKWTYDYSTGNWTNGRPEGYCFIKDCPFYTKVRLVGGKPAFQIYKEGEEEPFFCSSNSNASDPFHIDNRRIYFCEYNNKEDAKTRYVLFRITEADVYSKISGKPTLDNTESGTANKKKLYVNILQLRINPEFDLKKIQKAGSVL